MLTFADATCALVGTRYGMTRYLGASKSLEGSVAFVVVAFFCVHVPLLLWSDVGRAESLLIAATLALLVMLLEGSAWRGLDNLFIPIGGYFLLRAYLSLDAAALLPRLLVTVALVILIVLVRRRTTLEDDSLVAGAFLCYVAWAVMGWRWLSAPLAIGVGYRWLSPPTPDNSRRMHDVPGGAFGLGGRHRLADARAHERWRGDAVSVHRSCSARTSRCSACRGSPFSFRTAPLPSLFWRAVVTSWVIVMVPYVLVTDADRLQPRGCALGAIGAIAIGTAAFVRRLARRSPQRRPRGEGGRTCHSSRASERATMAVSGGRGGHVHRSRPGGLPWSRRDG